MLMITFIIYKSAHVTTSLNIISKYNCYLLKKKNKLNQMGCKDIIDH